MVDENGDIDTSYSVEEPINPHPYNRLATPNEDAMITEIEFKTMRAMGFTSMQGIYAQGFYPTYVNYVNKNLIDELGFYRAYYAYELTFSQRVINWIAQNSEINFILDSKDLSELKSKTNMQIQETIMNNAKKRNERFESNSPRIGFSSLDEDVSYSLFEEKGVVHDKKYVKDYEEMNKSLINSTI